MSIIDRLIKRKPKQNNLPQEVERENYIMADGDHSQEELEYEIVEKEILPEKMICPDCGGITLVGLEFCDKCGGELVNNDN